LRARAQQSAFRAVLTIRTVARQRATYESRAGDPCHAGKKKSRPKKGAAHAFDREEAYFFFFLPVFFLAFLAMMWFSFFG